MVANVWKQYSNQGAPQLDKPLPFPPLGARNELDSNFSLASVLPMNGSDVDTRSEFMKRTSATENPSQPTVSWKYPTLIGPHATMTSFGANERLGWSLQSLCDTTSALIARGLSHSFWGKRRGGGGGGLMIIEASRGLHIWRFRGRDTCWCIQPASDDLVIRCFVCGGCACVLRAQVRRSAAPAALRTWTFQCFRLHSLKKNRRRLLAPVARVPQDFSWLGTISETLVHAAASCKCTVSCLVDVPEDFLSAHRVSLFFSLKSFCQKRCRNSVLFGNRFYFFVCSRSLFFFTTRIDIHFKAIV